MSLGRLNLWRSKSTIRRHPVATVLDGFVATIVARPVSLDPPDWILVEPDAFDHDNEEFFRHRCNRRMPQHN
jgi:hypothetical protein